MKKYIKFVILPLMFSGFVHAREMVSRADESTVAAQNSALEKNTEGKGYGPQSPRDLANKRGENKRIFSVAPDYRNMNLCNIHFHKNAEHKGGEFTAVAGGGNGHGSNGHGSQAGYQYNGKISAKESRPLDAEVCKSEHGGLQAGDTIELHYVHSSARVVPGATLGACLSETDSSISAMPPATSQVIGHKMKFMAIRLVAISRGVVAAAGSADGELRGWA